MRGSHVRFSSCVLLALGLALLPACNRVGTEEVEKGREELRATMRELRGVFTGLDDARHAKATRITELRGMLDGRNVLCPPSCVDIDELLQTAAQTQAALDILSKVETSLSSLNPAV